MISSAGQVDEVLRVQHQAEDVEAPRAQVEQHRLAAVPLQPGQAVEHELREPDQRPAPAGEPAAAPRAGRSSPAAVYSETDRRPGGLGGDGDRCRDGSAVRRQRCAVASAASAVRLRGLRQAPARRLPSTWICSASSSGPVGRHHVVSCPR